MPDSNFVANRDLTTERSMALLLTRLKGATTGGTPTGIHGTNIVDVKVLPGGQVLSETTENTITATTGPRVRRHDRRTRATRRRSGSR